MTDLNDRLRDQSARVIRRPTPATWSAAQPPLSGFATPGEIIATIRSDTPDPTRSDELIRALHALRSVDPDASLVLLDALTPKALRRVGTTSPEFREDVIVNLAWAIAEFRDLDHLDHVAHRLAGRATRRTWRRQQADRRWSDRSVALEAGLELVRPARPAEDDAVAALQLDHIAQLLADGLQSGVINAYDWKFFCDARIAPAFGFDRPDVDRAQLYRRARNLRRQLRHAC